MGFNEKVTNALATMFEKKEYKKSYLAIVEGEIKKEITINKNLKKEGKAIGVRMTTCEKEEGKESITHIKPLKYNKEKNLTLLEVVPVTGRQHQIRVHLYSIGHKILGDPIYGVNDDTAEAYLDKTLLIEERIKLQVQIDSGFKQTIWSLLTKKLFIKFSLKTEISINNLALKAFYEAKEH